MNTPLICYAAIGDEDVSRRQHARREVRMRVEQRADDGLRT
jgi:hypothetical protein